MFTGAVFHVVKQCNRSYTSNHAVGQEGKENRKKFVDTKEAITSSWSRGVCPQIGKKVYLVRLSSWLGPKTFTTSYSSTKDIRGAGTDWSHPGGCGLSICSCSSSS